MRLFTSLFCSMVGLVIGNIEYEQLSIENVSPTVFHKYCDKLMCSPIYEDINNLNVAPEYKKFYVMPRFLVDREMAQMSFEVSNKQRIRLLIKYNVNCFYSLVAETLAKKLDHQVEVSQIHALPFQELEVVRMAGESETVGKLPLPIGLKVHPKPDNAGIVIDIPIPFGFQIICDFKNLQLQQISAYGLKYALQGFNKVVQNNLTHQEQEKTENSLMEKAKKALGDPSDIYTISQNIILPPDQSNKVAYNSFSANEVELSAMGISRLQLLDTDDMCTALQDVMRNTCAPGTYNPVFPTSSIRYASESTTHDASPSRLETTFSSEPQSSSEYPITEPVIPGLPTSSPSRLETVFSTEAPESSSGYSSHPSSELPEENTVASGATESNYEVSTAASSYGYPSSESQEPSSSRYPSSEPSASLSSGNTSSEPMASSSSRYPSSEPQESSSSGYPSSEPSASSSSGYPSSEPSASSSSGYTSSEVPASSSSGYPSSELPASSSSGYPSSELPASSSSGYPSSELPASSSSGYPSSELPASSSSGYPSSELPASSSSGYPSSELPASSSSGYPSLEPSASSSSGYPSLEPSASSSSGYPSLEPSASSSSGYPSSELPASSSSGYPSLEPSASSSSGYPSLEPSASSSSGYPSLEPSASSTNGYPSSQPPASSSSSPYPSSEPQVSSSSGHTSSETLPPSSSSGYRSSETLPSSSSPYPSSEPQASSSSGYPSSEPLLSSASGYPSSEPPASSSGYPSSEPFPSSTSSYPSSEPPASSSGYQSSEPLPSSSSGYPSSEPLPSSSSSGYPSSEPPASSSGYPSSEPLPSSSSGYPSSEPPASSSRYPSSEPPASSSRYPSSEPPASSSGYPSSEPLPSSSSGYPSSEPLPSSSSGYPSSEPLPSSSSGYPSSEPLPSSSSGYPSSELSASSSSGYPSLEPLPSSSSGYPSSEPLPSSSSGYSSSEPPASSTEPLPTSSSGYPSSEPPASSSVYTSSEPLPTSSSGFPSSEPLPTYSSGYPSSEPPASSSIAYTSSEPQASSTSEYPSSETQESSSSNPAHSEPFTASDQPELSSAATESNTEVSTPTSSSTEPHTKGPPSTTTKHESITGPSSGETVLPSQGTSPEGARTGSTSGTRVVVGSSSTPSFSEQGSSQSFSETTTQSGIPVSSPLHPLTGSSIGTSFRGSPNTDSHSPSERTSPFGSSQVTSSSSGLPPTGSSRVQTGSSTIYPSPVVSTSSYADSSTTASNTPRRINPKINTDSTASMGPTTPKPRDRMILITGGRILKKANVTTNMTTLLDTDHASNAVEAYYPDREGPSRHEIKASMRVPRMLHVGGAVGGKVYVVGGKNRNGILNSTEIYDPETDTWTDGPDMPTERARSVAFTYRDRLYVMGGTNGVSNKTGRERVLSTCEFLDTTRMEWWNCQNMLLRSLDSVAVPVGEFIYVLGGRIGNHAADNVRRFDPRAEATEDAWEAMKQLSTTQFSIAAAKYGEGIVECDYSSCSEYDEAADLWFAFPSFPESRRDCRMVAWNDHLYALGGRTKNMKVFDEVLGYNATKQEWKVYDHLIEKRWAFYLVVV